LIQVVKKEYSAGYDDRKMLWCKQSLNVYNKKLYSENVVTDMHNNSRDLNIELYTESRNNTFSNHTAVIKTDFSRTKM